MKSQFLWVVARFALLVLGIYAFSNLVHESTNFDPLGGLVSGLIVFAFVLFTVTKKPVRREEMLSLTAPFWPPWSYPQAYWFTTGGVISLSSSVNLIFHLGNPNAVRLYIATTLFGAGWLGGAIFARYRLSKAQ
jgi:hypothetical protein